MIVFLPSQELRADGLQRIESQAEDVLQTRYLL